MFHRIAYITLFVSLSFSVDLVKESYNFEYNDNQKTLNIENQLEYLDLPQKLNDIYEISSESLIELGILPFSTLYLVENNKNYSVQIDVTSSYMLENIIIDVDDNVLNNNVLSDRMSMRGVDVIQITYFPFEYDADSQTLTIVEDVNITILESDSIQNNDLDENVIPISREFEKILSDMVVNLELGDRVSDNLPSILFICGGSSASNSYLQDLIQWRKEQGYKVFVESTSNIGSSYNSISNYIEDAYYNWEFPPEYIVLVGDTSGGYEVASSTSSGGSSDYGYTLIDGDDLLPEMFIGRISANSSSDINNIVNKTLAYEKATFIDYTGSDWYESSALVGDPSATGNSAIITNEYIENILNAHEFENVETCYGCSYSNWMQNRLEDGILYFNYRGYIGTSGFGSTHINNANNGYMNPFVTFITCATGDFSWTSISEDFIRAGSVSNPKGGVAAVGTATSSTHTVPNNIVDMGIYDGIFAKDIRTAGGALVSGKMSLHSTYPQNPSQMTYKFTHWNNLMGDPVLNLWTDTPGFLNVEYSDMINMGTDLLEFNILDSHGEPVSGARIVVYINDDNVYYSFTDDQGYASIQFSDSISSDASITILKKNFIPFVGSVAVFNEDMHVQLGDEIYVDDQNPTNQGTPDGIANPGEIIDLYLSLENVSLNNIQLLDTYISSNSEKIDIINGNIEVENLIPGTLTELGPMQIQVHPDLVSTDDTNLILTLMDGDDGLSDWNFSVPFVVIAPNMEIEYVSPNSSLNPGQIVELDISFENTGEQELENCHMSVEIISSLIDLVQPESFIGNILPGQSAVNLDDIIVDFSEDIIDGSIFNFSVNVYNDNGFSQDLNFNLTVGTPDEHDPLGPDSYGYYIYDWTDVGYSLTPFYEWIELDPSQGGQGTDMGISDPGNGNNPITNSTKYIDLPFTFTFYGQDYNEVSVNANGWISFGHSNMESFRNYQLPGAGGPSPMVAAFWDDLKTDSNSKVFKYIADDYVVIEWKDMRTYQHNDIQTFQIILYDSITPTGDDEIKIQYQEFNNTTNGDYTQYTPYHGCYSTVGIENHLGTIGLEYTFNNEYPIAAAEIQNQSALFITTQNTTVLNSGDVNQDDEINILDIVMVINHILSIETLDSIGQFVADMDNNEDINILDVILMINLILNS